MTTSVLSLLYADELDAMAPVYRDLDALVWDGVRAIHVKGNAPYGVPMFGPDEIDPEKAITQLLVAAGDDGPTCLLRPEEPWYERVRLHFERRCLPFHAVVKHPDTPLEVPSDVLTVESPLLPAATGFYAVTDPQLLGRRPVRAYHQLQGMFLDPMGVLTVVLPAATAFDADCHCERPIRFVSLQGSQCCSACGGFLRG